MAITTPKTKKPVTEAIEVQPVIEAPIEKQVIKKNSKKSAIAQSSADAESKEVIEPVENEVKPLGKKGKTIKTKVIRDSFSFPEQDYLKISELKKTCLTAGIHVKKSEILRAGLQLLTKLTLTELKQVIEQVEKVQTGRPNSSKI